MAPVDGERLGRPAHAADGEDLSGRRRVNQRRHLATDAVALWLQQIQTETHGRRRINGVAALLHDTKPGGAGQIMP
jgi:hypothetical protein